MASPVVDGSGRYAEAISPSTSPPERYASALTEMMGNSSPIPVETDNNSGYPPPNEKKHHPGGPTYYSAPEVVEQSPPQYGQYGGPPPGSPPQVAHATFNQKGEPIAHGEEAQHTVDEPKIMGMRKRRFFIAVGIIAIIVLAIALGAGLGAGLKKKKNNDSSSSDSEAPIVDPLCKDNPELCVGGALDSRFYSQKGAFNGSGIALAGESWNSGQRRLFTLYFQHHTGDIRYMQYRTDKQWDGGEKAQTVATDAKNGTAISAVSYALNGTQYFHIFYISKNNTIKQMTKSNSTDSSDFYEPGKLSDLNLSVMDSPTVGLQACWKGDYYGGDDPASDSLRKEDVRGINIWFASDPTTFEQYSWNNGKDEWTRENPWKGKNGHAGVGCYSWGTGPFSYTIMVNDQNNTEIWWIDTNSTAQSTKEHPINSWTNSTKGGITGVYPTTSFGFTTYLYMQMADRSVNAYDIEWAAENTTAKGDPITIRDLGGPVKGLGGTHLTLTAYNETVKDENGTAVESLWDSLYVFYQTEGDDITAFSRPILGGEWTDGKLQIPDI